MNNVVDASLLSRDSWSGFVLSHPDGNIFHTPEYFDLCTEYPLYDPVSLAVTDGDSIKGILVGVIQREFRGIVSFITARAVVMGGPLVKDNDVAIALLLIKSFTNTLANRILFSQFRNLADMSVLKDAFEGAGYRHEPHLNIIIRLDRSVDALQNDLHPARRKQIGRSRRRGVIVKEADPCDESLMDRCFSLLTAVYRQQRLPFPAREFFHLASKHLVPGGRLRLFVASTESEIIGFRLVLDYHDVLYDWYAAADPGHYDKYPNDILPWEIVRHGAEEKLQHFDFGGAGTPGKSYGVRDYKMKFGGELVSYGRYNRIHMPLIYYPIMGLFNLRRKMTRR